MERKDNLDAFGATALIAMSALLGFNQVVISVTNGGLQPVFVAGLRSVGAVVCLCLWFWLRGRRVGLGRVHLGPGMLAGLFFSAEFILLFTALDLTTVGRASVMLYSMPLWLALMGHVLLPGERITVLKGVGLVLAFCGVAVAILWRNGTGGQGSLLGDLMAMGAAIGWAATAVVARTGLKDITADRQLIWQVLVSAPILIAVAPLFGPLIRDLAPIHLWGLAFQIVVVVTFGFTFWLWLLSIYPAAGVASFSFLAPIFGVAFGWLFLGERLGAPTLVALALVCAGLVLINRPTRQVPQKV